MNINPNILALYFNMAKKHTRGFHKTVKFSSLILFLSLFSCADDLGYKPDPVNPDGDFTGITLFLPNIDGAAEFGATRTDGYANTRAYDQAREGNFNTLYITAIGEDKKAHIFLKNQSDGIVEEIYSKYSISLPAGKYKFYVVANMNRYLFNGNETTSFYEKIHNEEDPEKVIRELILNFSSNRPLEPGFLPMACLTEEIKVGTSAATADRSSIDPEGYVNVPTGNDIHVYANLNYLCSKVRYTIIFDREKSDFANGDIIDVHRNTNSVPPMVTNLRQQTAINTGNDGGVINKAYLTDNSGNSQWPLFLDRYIYNGKYTYMGVENNIDFYTETDNEKIKQALGSLTQWKESDGEWNKNGFLNKRAWQGVTYLPENLVEDDGMLATQLIFPYSFNGAEGAESPRKIQLTDFKISGSETVEHGIRRAKMYDVYAVIKTPDPEQWTLTVILEDWTLQNLAYQLHGPYELVVETTTIEELSMEKDAIFWFRSDIPPSEIGFISPKVSKSGTAYNDMVDLYLGEVVKNKDGSYATNENGDYLFRVRLNPDIPYKVIDQLNHGGLDYGEGDDKFTYTKKDIAYFHLVAGSLNKYIEIENLNLDPYLLVDPQTIIIDTRELYTSGEDGATYPINIQFETNVDLTDATYATLELSDPDKLIGEGKGEGSLRFVKEEIAALFTGSGSTYTYKDVQKKVNSIVLRIKNIIYGNPYWDQNNQYNLTFTLTIKRKNEQELKIVKPVSIRVKPFSGTYVIHFRDNTKDWEQAHIYIFQDLTLPSNMQVYNETTGKYEPYEHAGRIVGFIEYNPTSGFQWNAAVQYVFTNNLSFRGWYGNHKAKLVNGKYISEVGNEYGGTVTQLNGQDIYNDPWAEAHFNTQIPDGTETALTTASPTYGFVMFGSPDKRTSHGEQHDFWNYDYSYNVTYDVDENPQRRNRYYYNVNFNSDHMKSNGDWNCWACTSNAPDFNGNNDDRFYPGIAMEKEADGWWKYTLTGVAQPGRSVIIFANWHEPWSPDNKWYDFRAEDYRWPGDYEAGLPLFDFEDNEGWFLFDGNTSNNDQQFTDKKPTNVLPHKFTAAYSSMSIQVKTTSITSIKVDETSVSNYTDKDGIRTFNASGLNLNEKETIKVVAGGKNYTLAPKFFKSGANGYTTAQPLYTEYTDGIKLYVKWNDQIQPNPGYWSGPYYNQLVFYYPPAGGGSNYLNVYWGSDENWNRLMKSYHFDHNTDKEIGNYKHIDFETINTTGNDDKLELRLCTKEAGDARYYKILNVEDLPQYYYPAEDKYLINWHFLDNPY